jgi:hypothetical protein
MADLWMDVDTALAEVPVNLMPLVDDDDFITIKAAVAYDEAGMDLRWNFVTTAGAMSSTAVTPTTSGTYDWAHQGDGIYSIEIPASGGASINNDTEGFGWFTGVATDVAPWRGPIIGFRAAALNNSLIDGATIDVNVTAVSGDTTAADNLELDYDGTGLTKANSLIGGIAGTVTSFDTLISDREGEWTALASPNAGTAQGGSGTTITLHAASSAVDDYYLGQLILITGETGIGQVRRIIGYVGATKVATVSTWATAPDSSSMYEMLADADSSVSSLTAAAVADAVWDESTVGHATSGTFGEQLKTDVDAILADTGTDGVIVASLASGSITATSIADGAIDAGAIASDAITSAKIADGAITAAKIATDAIDNDALSSDAVTAIQSGLATAAALQTVDDTADAILLDTGTDGVVIGALSSNAISDATLAADLDIYQAKTFLLDDDGGSADRYVTVWFKNAARVTSGITSPTIQVVKVADGTDLIASTAMTEIGSTEMFRYTATSAERVTSGAGYVAIVGATIDGTARSDATPVGRDST